MHIAIITNASHVGIISSNLLSELPALVFTISFSYPSPNVFLTVEFLILLIFLPPFFCFYYTPDYVQIFVHSPCYYIDRGKNIIYNYL